MFISRRFTGISAASDAEHMAWQLGGGGGGTLPLLPHFAPMLVVFCFLLCFGGKEANEKEKG